MPRVKSTNQGRPIVETGPLELRTGKAPIPAHASEFRMAKYRVGDVVKHRI